MTKRTPEALGMPALLTLGEVAGLFRVSKTSVRRWEREGRLGCVRTPGGHRRYLRSQVADLLHKQFATATTRGSWI